MVGKTKKRGRPKKNSSSGSEDSDTDFDDADFNVNDFDLGDNGSGESDFDDFKTDMDNGKVKREYDGERKAKSKGNFWFIINITVKFNLNEL